MTVGNYFQCQPRDVFLPSLIEAPTTERDVLIREEARAKVKATIGVVNRWMDSDIWVPWSPPASEDEQRIRDQPGAMRPEIEANENRVWEQFTTAHKARSLGKETVHPSTFEETAIAVMKEFNWAATSDIDDISEPVVTAVDNDHAVSLGQLSILQQVKRPGISTVENPDEWIEIEITVDSGACVTVMPRSLCEGISILQN